MEFKKYTVEELVKLGMLEKPMDGNHGGKHPTSKDYVRKGIPFIMVSDITNGKINYNTCKFITKDVRDGLDKGFAIPGDVLLSHKATIGMTTIVGDEFDEIVLTPQLTYYRVQKDINNYYLKYYFDTMYFQKIFKNWATSGSTRAYLGITAQLKLPILLPDINNQNKIAKVLLDIDKKIELNNSMNDNLKKMCSEYYWYLIGEGFKELSLAELMDYQGGSQPPAAEFQYESLDNNIRFVQIRDFDTDSHMCYIPISNKNKICQKDDILIARYGASLGRICYGLDGAYNVALAKVLPKEDKYKEIIRTLLEAKEFYEYINNVGQRSAQAGFNKGDIQAYKVKIPLDNCKIVEYNNFAKKCLNKRLLNVEQNSILFNLRSTLLPKLMNGQINLDKIEI